MAGKLTATKVANLKTPGRYGDGGGLWFQVRDPAHRSWIVRYTRHGKARHMGVGPYPEVSLADAREAAAAARRLLREGEDPIEARQRGAKLKRQRKTFREACAAWLESRNGTWVEDHTRAVKHSLDEACEVIGNMAAADVTAADVLRVLQPMWRERNPTAVRLRGRIENVLSYAITMEWRGGPNPALWRGNMENLLPKPGDVHEVKNHPALPWEAVPEFMVAAAEMGGMSALALRFCVLNAPRSGMVLGATWGEIDVEDRIWSVPKDRMKGRKGQRAEFRIPLSSASVAILEEVKPLDAGPDSPVFPSPQGGFLDDSVMRVLRDRMEAAGKITIGGYPAGRITIHGFRSTFTDWGEDNGWPGNVIQASLAHKEPNKVTRAYKRTDLLEQRRKLMEAWGQYCTTPKVVPLQKEEAAA